MARRKARTPREEWLGNLAPEFQDCRDLGHHWRPVTGGWQRDVAAWARTLACARCGTQRRQVISGTGHVTRNAYTYANGYVAPKGSDPISRDTIRLAAIERQLGGK
jgi:hypothetical protein